MTQKNIDRKSVRPPPGGLNAYECAWLDNFQDIQEARAALSRFIDHYNHERPHQALDYRTPREVFLTHQPAA